MTHLQVAEMIRSMGMPFAYYQFTHAPTLPFIVYYYPSSDDFMADNVNYAHIEAINIELYSDSKDFTKEKTIEDVLKANGIGYRKNETFIEDEKMYQVLYESEVLINE